MRGVNFMLLLLLIGPYGLSLAEEGDSSTASSPLTSDEYVGDLPAAAASEITRGDIDQATASEDLGTVDVQGQEGGKEPPDEESGGEYGGDETASSATISTNSGEPATASAAAAVSQVSSTHDVADAAAEPAEGQMEEKEEVVLSSGEERGEELEQEAGDDGLLVKSAGEDVPLRPAEPQLVEDAVEGDDHHDNPDESSAEERTDGETGTLGEQRGGFINGWRRRLSGEEAGQPLKEALQSYDSLLKEHYLKMSFAQATALGVMGDAIAQRLERRWNPGQRFEWKRTAHAGVLNMIIDGIFTPQWYNVVDHVNDDMTLPAAFAKALAASAVYGPFANGMFLAGARLLRYGSKTRFDWNEWRRQLLVCTVRDFEMWPPLHILNFWLVPRHWRPLVGHLAGVALLSVISSTGLTDAGLPLGQRALPLAMRLGRRVADAWRNGCVRRDGESPVRRLLKGGDGGWAGRRNRRNERFN